MASEQSIRITARGEFSQLENGLKNLQKDLKSVLGEIDKGARKGGFFDDTQLRALDVYRTRFKSTMDELNREFQKQNDTIDQLYKRQQNSSKDMQKQIQEEINKREKLLDKLRRQMIATEDLYGKRNKEANGYRTPGEGSPTSRENDAEEEGTFSRTGGYQGGSGGSLGGAIAGGAGGIMSRIMKLGGFVLGMAGVGGIASTAMDAYRLAFNSQVTPMNLSQRIRGQGYNGSAKNMWDMIGSIGRSSGMGYTSEESWNFQDMLSRQVGTQSPLDLRNGLMFGRGYGLETGEAAQGLGSIRALGGASSITQIANMVAGSVAQSGMTPRILEVMQTSAGLLASMNTTLKDNGAKQILAYQTTLDTIGNQKGMMQLTGAQGANVIQGLGGIYNPSPSNPWAWMGVQALQQYNPKKYGNMGLYDLQANFEDGLLNTDNLPAMTKYLKQESGGNVNTMKRMIQSWLQAGGYNATKTQVNDLYSATNGFTAFDSNKINSIISKNDAGDGNAKYQERMGQLGQQILDTNANFEKDLENIGQPILSIAQTLKGGITDALNKLVGDQSGGNDPLTTAVNDFKKFMKDFDWKKAGELLGAGFLATKGLKALFHGGGSGGEGGGGGGLPAIIGGGKNLVKGALKADALISPFVALWQTLGGDPNDQKSQDAMAKKAGMGKSTGTDRFFVNLGHDLTFGLLPKQNIWDALNIKKQADKLDKWFQSMFPDTRSKEEKAYDKAVLEGKDPKTGKYRGTTIGQKIATGKGTTDPNAKSWWQKLWDGVFKGDAPVNDQELIKSGVVKPNQKYYDDQNAKKAFGDLKNMSNDGRLYIENMSKYGQQELQKLADQGLIKMKDGYSTQVTTLSGFTDAGKKALLDMQKQGLIDLGGMTSDGTAKITALSSEGQKRLEELKKSGSIDIANFHTESSKHITSLTTDGLKQIVDLQKNGSLSMDSMNEGTLKDIAALKKDSSNKMGDIVAEHKDFNKKTTGKDGIFTNWASSVTSIFSKWADGFSSWWKGIFGGGSSSSGGGTASLKSGSFIGNNIAGLKNYRADMNSNVSASTINKMLAGTSLAGHGQDFIDVGTKTGVDPAFLVAQAYAEQSFKNPKGSNNLFGLTNGLGFQTGYTTANDGQKLAMFPSIKAGIMAAATNLQGKNYLGKGNDTVEGISHTWVGTPYWGQEANNIYYMLNKLGVGSNASSYGGGGSNSIMNAASAAGFGIGDTSLGSWGSNLPAFANWQNGILSPFGDMRGRTTPHTGLDIAEKQGTPLQALAGGKLSFLYMDDGGKYDSDGKANTREGGTEMGIKMPNGQTYFYSHLSGINPALLKQWQSGNRNINISAGEYLANSGGAIGAPGSGYGSEGQHLHLGYLDSKGHYLDPAQLLDEYASNSPAIQQASGGVQQIEVTVKFEGQGAGELNGMTQNTLRKMIQQAIKAYEAQKVSLNPSM